MQGFPIAREAAPNNKVDRAPFSALPITRAANPLGTASREAAPTLFFARQAMAFFLRIFVATVVLLACALCGPVPAQAAPRPAIAFVHRLLPPEGERRTGLMDWVRSHDLARDILESQRIATVVAAVEQGRGIYANIRRKPSGTGQHRGHAPGSAHHHQPAPLRGHAGAFPAISRYRLFRLHGRGRGRQHQRLRSPNL